MYISGDTIINYIKPLIYLNKSYYIRYIKNYTNNSHIIDIDKPIINVQVNHVIFITKVEYLDIFYRNVLSKINNKFILITHYGDGEINSKNHQKIVDHPLLLKWYGQNMGIISNKTEGLPIGLENSYWKRTNQSILNNCYNTQKNKLLYLNFSLKTNSKRIEIMSTLQTKGFTKNIRRNWDEYMKELSNYKFCISPPGNGFDCHRTWECLYAGVIPIVIYTKHFINFRDLPILFVDNYNSISTDYLNTVYTEFKYKIFNMDKLTIEYWQQRIITGLSTH